MRVLLLLLLVACLKKSHALNAKCASITSTTKLTITELCKGIGTNDVNGLIDDASTTDCSSTSCTASNDGTTCCKAPGCESGKVYSNGKCTDCVAGRVSKWQAAKCSHCDPCKKEYSAAGATFCETCGETAGEFWHSEKKQCFKCSTGKVRRAEKQGERENKGTGVLEDCKLTDPSAGDECNVCDADKGLYSNEFGQAECKQCPNGKEVDRKLFDPLKGGICLKTEVEWAEMSNDHKTSFTQNECPSSKTCIDCPAGKLGGEGRCTPCNQGRFNGRKGQTACSVCGAGKYQDQNEQQNCKSCGVGKYSSVAGSKLVSNCLDCAPGQYQEVVAQTSCKLCASGQHQYVKAQTACKNCDQGKSALGTGQVKCDQCTFGKYQNENSKNNCKSCAPSVLWQKPFRPLFDMME